MENASVNTTLPVFIAISVSLCTTMHLGCPVMVILELLIHVNVSLIQ